MQRGVAAGPEPTKAVQDFAPTASWPAGHETQPLVHGFPAASKAALYLPIAQVTHALPSTKSSLCRPGKFSDFRKYAPQPIATLPAPQLSLVSHAMQPAPGVVVLVREAHLLHMPPFAA